MSRRYNLRFKKLEDIPEDRNYIEADPQSREIKIVDTSRNILTISSSEGLEDLISFLRTVPKNRDCYIYETNSKARGIIGKLKISGIKTEELITYLWQAEIIANPIPYLKEF